MKNVFIILANLMDQQGSLNPETISRICNALSYVATLDPQYIILCGWPYRADCSISIAKAMFNYIESNTSGLSHLLRCQTLSRDTVGDAVFSRIYIEQIYSSLQPFSIHIFTSCYHVKRTKLIFDFTFPKIISINVHGCVLNYSKQVKENETASIDAFRRTFGNVKSRDLGLIYATLITYHPFYNGVLHSRMPSLLTIQELFKGISKSQGFGSL